MLFILHTQILILSGSRAEAVRYTLCVNIFCVSSHGRVFHAINANIL